MTPFKRVSSAQLNVIWGFANLLIGLYITGLANNQNAIIMPWQANNMSGLNLWSYLIGVFILAMVAAWLFGRPNARLPWHKD